MESNYQTVSATNIHETDNNLYVQVSNALTGNAFRGSAPADQTPPRPSKSPVFGVPVHLVQTHNTLRFMQSRDMKTKILYTLNYFRSIQKRLMLDLREFGTRERVVGDVADPHLSPEEGDQAVKDGLNLIVSSTAPKREPGESTHKTGPHGVSLVDLKKLRRNGHFHEKHSATCPILPRFHATYGEASQLEPEFVDNDRNEDPQPIQRESLKYLNRIDRIEIEEATQEVFVKDDFNIYVMYECSMTDMQVLEQEMLRVGSHFVSKMEELYDTEVDKVVHKKDRQQVIHDLLKCELDFQFKKVQLTQLYVECYEHICDPLEQQRLIQTIVDTMARRPRLSLENLYFRGSYKAEMECFDHKIELLETIIHNQMELEKRENTHLHESLNLSYTLAQKKHKDGWTYDDADQFLQNLIDRYKSESKVKPQRG
jgi:hypothetical protein